MFILRRSSHGPHNMADEQHFVEGTRPLHDIIKLSYNGLFPKKEYVNNKTINNCSDKQHKCSP